MTRPEIAYRRDIDGLRAIAVLPVLAFHAFPDWLPGGFMGVDVFFVISGFLISRIIQRELEAARFGFVDFYLRRARRILPSLAIVLLAVLVVGWFLLIPGEYKHIGKHVAAGAAFVSNMVLLDESSYFDPSSETNPLLHLWSLAVEEQFYLAWPLLLFLAWRAPALRHWTIASLLLASFALNALWVRTDQPLAFYSPLSRVWELAVGALLAQVLAAYGFDTAPPSQRGSRRLADVSIRDLTSFAGAALIAASLALLDKTQAFPGWWALLPTLGAACLIAAGPAAVFNRLILSSQPLVWIGLVSFQLYLWHWPLLVFERRLFLDESTSTTRLAALALSFPLAWATYSLVDKPIRLGCNLARKALATCVATAVIGATGFWVHASNGFPQRFPSLMQELASFSFDYGPAYREGLCFLTPEQNESAYSPVCDALSTPATLPRVVLWGDSHAAHLYPGLLRVSRGRFDLAQYTTSACPPLIGVEIAIRPNCKHINDQVLLRIQAHLPDTVVLSAVWQTYSLENLVPTIERLRESGVRNVVVAGQAPHWPKRLPELVSTVASEHDLSQVPERLQWSGYDDAMNVDRTVSELVKAQGATFFSTTGILCKDGSCLVRTNSDPLSLTAWDQGHLTTTGSEYVALHFPAGLLPGRVH